jgi:protein phosphatase PTC1
MKFKVIYNITGSITNERVQGLISVTRSMGDSMLHPYIIADPYIKVHELSILDQFLIIGCDGVWDVITDDQAVQMSKEILEDKEAPLLDEVGNPRKELVQIAAEKIRDIAYDRGSTDNISVLIIDINPLFKKQK